MNNKHCTLIANADEQANIVSFASYHMEGEILIKIELSKNGKDCKISVKSSTENQLPMLFRDAILDIIQVQ